MSETYSSVDFYTDADNALSKDGLRINGIHWFDDSAEIVRAFHLERYLVGNRKRGIRLIIDIADDPENTSVVAELEDVPEIDSQVVCWIGLAKTVAQLRSDNIQRGLHLPEQSRILQVSQREQGSLEYFMGRPRNRVGALEQFIKKIAFDREEFLKQAGLGKLGFKTRGHLNFLDQSERGVNSRSPRDMLQDGRCEMVERKYGSTWARRVN